MATDFPEPDSPTMARISPSSTDKLMPSTARKEPVAVANSTVKLAISSNAISRTS